MSNCADPTRLSPDERFREVAAILASGVRRLRERAALATEVDKKNLPKSPPAGLEVPEETRLSVRVG
jgi:hypothetical protein